jgi:hypothetical protein
MGSRLQLSVREPEDIAARTQRFWRGCGRSLRRCLTVGRNQCSIKDGRCCKRCCRGRYPHDRAPGAEPISDQSQQRLTTRFGG